MGGCDLLLNAVESDTLYLKSHFNHTVNIQSGLGLSRVVGEKICLQILKGKQQDFMWWQGLHLYFNSFNLLDPVLSM